jgi:pyruvate dehydrogenase E2 component (dihydrolipoyllysine-residue acetyltransferase)
MPTNVIMPALELAQESGKVLRWLKAPGDRVQKGDPLVEIETDKITTEIEAPESGILGEVTAREGQVVPVGQTIARIVEAAGVVAAAAGRGPTAAAPAGAGPAPRTDGAAAVPSTGAAGSSGAAIKASPLARKIAEQHGVDLAQVKASGGTIQKADVLAYVESRKAAPAANGAAVRLAAASPKARRLAAERGLDISALVGSGPGGAVLAADVASAPRPAMQVPAARVEAPPAAVARPEAPGVSTIWRVMAERMTASWTTAPHFYLVREVNVSRLATWRERASKQTSARITYTDLLVKLVGAALARHPAVNASWKDGAIVRHAEINLGLAVAIAVRQAAPGRHPGRRLHDQQPGDVRRRRLQRHRQPASGGNPGRGAHRRPGGSGQWPAGGPADDGPDAIMRPPDARRGARRAVPRHVGRPR